MLANGHELEASGGMRSSRWKREESLLLLLPGLVSFSQRATDFKPISDQMTEPTCSFCLSSSLYLIQRTDLPAALGQGFIFLLIIMKIKPTFCLIG